MNVTMFEQLMDPVRSDEAAQADEWMLGDEASWDAWMDEQDARTEIAALFRDAAAEAAAQEPFDEYAQWMQRIVPIAREASAAPSVRGCGSVYRGTSAQFNMRLFAARVCGFGDMADGERW